MYEEVLAKMLPGDVLLTNRKGVNFGSLPIKIANFCKRFYKDRGWTHAALYIGNDEVIEAFPGGIVKRNVKEAYFNGDYNLLILRHKNASEEAIGEWISFCKSETGEKYDVRALAYFLFYNFFPHQLHFLLDNKFMGQCFNVENSYFCSELVATGLQKAGIYCFEREPYKIMPIDFFNGLIFDAVDRIDLPSKDSASMKWIKAAVFIGAYIIASILFPFLLIAAVLLIAFLTILIAKGIILALLFIISFINKKSKKEQRGTNNDR